MGLLTPLAVRIGAISWMPRLLPQIVWVDTRLQKVTRGRVTVLDIAGLPNLALTVPGRKSGVPRTTPLLCVPHEGGWLIAGSYFGGPAVPLWVGNLRATDDATIEIDATTFHVTWREIEGRRAGPDVAGHARDVAELREVRGAHQPGHPGLLPATRDLG